MEAQISHNESLIEERDAGIREIARQIGEVGPWGVPWGKGVAGGALVGAGGRRCACCVVLPSVVHQGDVNLEPRSWLAAAWGWRHCRHRCGACMHRNKVFAHAAVPEHLHGCFTVQVNEMFQDLAVLINDQGVQVGRAFRVRWGADASMAQAGKGPTFLPPTPPPDR